MMTMKLNHHLPLTLKAAVIGYPISHSLSPKLHQYWLDKYGLKGEYHAIEVKENELPAKIRWMQEQGYRGFNVTVPLKKAIIPFCDELKASALQVGAVNMVSFNEAGGLIGQNTDEYGFIANLEQSPSFKDWPHYQNIVILGAGGAAYAVFSGLIQKNIQKITLINRNQDSILGLIEHFQKGKVKLPQLVCSSWQADMDFLKDTDLLINATSLGMKGMDPLKMDLSKLSPHALVHDIVYRPLMTQLLQDAKLRGNPIQDGLGMLLHQAAPAFKQWFLKEDSPLPPVDTDLRQMILSNIG